MLPLTIATILERLLFVFLLSLAYGMVRQRMHKPIGFGTYLFVAMGACGLSLVAIILPTENPLPLLSAVVTGIGFLGAGALIKTSDKVVGFTSAASIWIFAIFGLLAGLGNYLLSSAMYATVWVVMAIDKYLENKSIGAYQKKLTLNTTSLVPTVDLEKIFAGREHKLLSIEVNKKEDKMIAVFYVEGTKQELNTLSRELLHQSWFGSCKVE
ncbi:MgtC/SapB family protein [Candidatus Woesearchaeota archaeon]|nr:MgtC/SapB family protein [Candidatus Woesearchaeota archaeon]